MVSALVKCRSASGRPHLTFRQQGISVSPQICRCANRQIINHVSRLAKYRYSCYDWCDHMNIEPLCPHLSACSVSFSSLLRFPQSWQPAKIVPLIMSSTPTTRTSLRDLYPLPTAQVLRLTLVRLELQWALGNHYFQVKTRISTHPSSSRSAAHGTNISRRTTGIKYRTVHQPFKIKRITSLRLEIRQASWLPRSIRRGKLSRHAHRFMLRAR